MLLVPSTLPNEASSDAGKFYVMMNSGNLAEDYRNLDTLVAT